MMASEPVLRNPTNIDVDDRGRIWVTEAFNYRPFRNTTTSPEGDRIMILEAKDGDDSADRKEIVSQGISGEQHDHGRHAFTSGADGKLYFNFGNAGVSLRDKNNKPVIDQYGDSIGSPKYRQGMVFRCDPDGSHVERLAHNFRNNYEVAV